jgi:hypothetical protein
MIPKSANRFSEKVMLEKRAPDFTVCGIYGMRSRMNRSVHIVRQYMTIRFGGPAEDVLR